MAAVANSVVVSTIEAIQEFNKSISGMIHCPELADYPASIETADLPMSFAEPESVSFGGFADNEATIDIVVRVYFDAIGQQQFAEMKKDLFELMDDYQTYYTTEANYQQAGAKVIQKEPVRLSIVDGLDAFNMTGYQLNEYPVGSGFWYHGFELRFVVTAVDWSCAR